MRHTHPLLLVLGLMLAACGGPATIEEARDHVAGTWTGSLTRDNIGTMWMKYDFRPDGTYTLYGGAEMNPALGVGAARDIGWSENETGRWEVVPAARGGFAVALEGEVASEQQMIHLRGRRLVFGREEFGASMDLSRGDHSPFDS